MPLPVHCTHSANVSSQNALKKAGEDGRSSVLQARAGLRWNHLSAHGAARSCTLGIGYLIFFLGTAAMPGMGLKLIGSFGIFLFMFHLALVGHEAGHGSLTRSAASNRWIGRLAFLASYTPFSSWLASHNALHHTFTNLRGKDPLCAPLSKQEYDRLSPVQRALQRLYRTLLGVTIYSIRFGWTNLLFPEPSVLAHIPRRTVFKLERCAVLGFLVLQVGGLLVWQHFLEQTWQVPAETVSGLGAAIVMPFLIMNWWTGLMSFLHHTHPQVRWYADFAEWRQAQAGVECTVHLIAPWPIGWLLGNSLEHTAHHVAPKVPDGELSVVQEQLHAAFPEIIQRVNLTDCLRILALCKLYDYQQHRWLDFDGKPTTESI